MWQVPAGGNSWELLAAARAMTAPQAALVTARELGQGTAGSLHSHNGAPMGAGGEAAALSSAHPQHPGVREKSPGSPRAGREGERERAQEKPSRYWLPPLSIPAPPPIPTRGTAGLTGGVPGPALGPIAWEKVGGAATGAVLRGSQDGGQGGARRPRRCPAPLPRPRRRLPPLAESRGPLSGDRAGGGPAPLPEAPLGSFPPCPVTFPRPQRGGCVREESP